MTPWPYLASFRVGLFIDFFWGGGGVAKYMGKRSGCFMIISWPISQFVSQWRHEAALRRHMLTFRFDSKPAAASIYMKMLLWQKHLFSQSYKLWIIKSIQVSMKICAVFSVLAHSYWSVARQAAQGIFPIPQELCWAKPGTVVRGGSLVRVATAQGKQGIWFLLFPDRENTGNFVLTQGKIC